MWLVFVSRCRAPPLPPGGLVCVLIPPVSCHLSFQAIFTPVRFLRMSLCTFLCEPGVRVESLWGVYGEGPRGLAQVSPAGVLGGVPSTVPPLHLGLSGGAPCPRWGMK